MARTADRKLAIARRIHDLAVDKLRPGARRPAVRLLTFPIFRRPGRPRKDAIETLERIRP